MKLNKRMVSLILVVLMLFNYLPSGQAAGTEVTVSGNLGKMLPDMEYGWDGSTFTHQFEAGALGNVAETHEVYLLADITLAEDEEIAVGETVDVTISNFRLDGANAADYTLPEITLDNPQIQIVQKKLTIIPAQTSAFYGQKTLDDNKLTELADYSSQVVGDDRVWISAEFEIKFEGSVAVGTYEIVQVGEIKVQGKDAGNYTVEMDKNVKFSINAYHTDAAVEPTTDNYNGVCETELEAPDGYLISTTNGLDEDNWAKSITVGLEETLNGSVTYYLRNNTKGEFYLAICEEKTFEYTSVSIPVVTGVQIELAAPADETGAPDEGAKLEFEEDGVYTNRDVVVTVFVKGATIAQDTTITFGEQSVTVLAADAVLGEDNKYTYQASFTITSTDGASAEHDLVFAVSNTSGTVTYPAEDSRDTFLGTNTRVTRSLIVDRAKPYAEITRIDGNFFGSVFAEFTIYDPEPSSGKLKVEYKWDNEQYQTLHNYQEEETDYSLTLRWWDAEEVENGKHTLWLRITDAMGNVTVISRTDDEGTDSAAPVIDSIEIKAVAEGTTVQNTSDGVLANGAVNIVIKAHDDTTNTNSYTKGVASVTVTAKYKDGRPFERTAAKTENADEYVLQINPEIELKEIEIKVSDGYNETTAKLKEAPTPYLSNDLYIDTQKPDISFSGAEDLANLEADGCFWYGSAASDELLPFYASDAADRNNGNDYVTAGIRSFTIAKVTLVDGVETLETLMSEVIAFGVETRTNNVDLSGFADGKYTIRVTVKDYCDNSNSKDFIFTKDTTAPASGRITPKSDIKVFDEENWFAPTDETNSITFRIGATNKEEKLSSIKITVNGEPLEYSSHEGKNVINEDELGSYVTIDTKDFPEVTDQYNQYVITAEIKDYAGNPTPLAYTVYVDKAEPTINDIRVQKKDESAFDKILRILTFGIYSNTDLTFKIKASDAQYDSGVDRVTMEFGAASSPYSTDEGTQIVGELHGEWYCFNVSANDLGSLGSGLAFTVYDRYGKSSVAFPFLENPENAKRDTDCSVNFVMIEGVAPDGTLSDILGDGFAREDGQVWYRENKELTLSVQDVDSGIYSIEVTVNGVPVTEALIKDESGVGTNVYLPSIPEVQDNSQHIYYFHTDTLAAIAAETDAAKNEGRYDIVINVTDNAGNVKTFENTYHVDEAKPTIDRITFEPATADGITGVDADGFVEVLEYGYFFNKPFDVTVHVSDEAPSSGLYAVNYRLVAYEYGIHKSETTGTQMIVDGKAVIDVPEGFVGQIIVEALDYAGNSSGEKTTKAYITDSNAPTISITPEVQTSYRDAKGQNLYTQKNEMTVVITDMVAGLKQIGYSKSAELAPYEHKTIEIANRAHTLNEELADGWVVTGVNGNLVTQVRKVFTFIEDDNDVAMHFDAQDRSLNKTAIVSSETFTVDTTAPRIDVVFREDSDEDAYYNQNRVVDITITERNFDASLINILIKNTFGSVPGYSFKTVSSTVHTVTIDFDEGDYTFDVNGKDLSGRDAIMTFAGGNEKLFYVDKTVPSIVENFAEFSYEKTEDSFNVDKTATITITEHNFDAGLTNLRITRKAAGAEHSLSGMVDVTNEILAGIRWNSRGDTHTITFTFDQDAVYYIEIAPVDLASNRGARRNTVVFEIDKTVPVVSAKNGTATSPDDTELLDIYSYARQDSPAPTVTFTDLNISHIEYTLTRYIPELEDDGLIVLKPVTTNHVVVGDQFTLEDFNLDGIYAVKMVAVDVAGNQSEMNYNTYARMVNQDVLAFILDSNMTDGTGLYSLEHPNGEAISKKPYDFKDLRIMVFAPAGTPIDIVLRDTNGNDIETVSTATMDDSLYGIMVYTYEISADYFKENFQDDIDMEMQLTVKNEDFRIDLARVHIDSIAPSCDFPEELSSWKSFVGEEDRTFTISNISELLAVEDCKIYDNGQLIPFEYSSEEDTITFTLSKGWHNVGFILCDAAGNANISQEMVNIHIGYFWVIVLAVVLTALVAGGIFTIVYRRRRAKQEMMEEA